MTNGEYRTYRENFQKLMSKMSIAELRSMRQSLEVISQMTNLQRLYILCDLHETEFKKTHDPFKDEFQKIIDENFFN